MKYHESQALPILLACDQFNVAPGTYCNPVTNLTQLNALLNIKISRKTGAKIPLAKTCTSRCFSKYGRKTL
jgi:hypothetical protein